MYACNVSECMLKPTYLRAYTPHNSLSAPQICYIYERSVTETFNQIVGVCSSKRISCVVNKKQRGSVDAPNKQKKISKRYQFIYHQINYWRKKIRLWSFNKCVNQVCFFSQLAVIEYLVWPKKKPPNILIRSNMIRRWCVVVSSFSSFIDKTNSLYLFRISLFYPFRYDDYLCEHRYWHGAGVTIIFLLFLNTTKPCGKRVFTFTRFVNLSP